MYVTYIGEGTTSVWSLDDKPGKTKVKTGETFECRDSIGEQYIRDKKNFIKTQLTPEGVPLDTAGVPITGGEEEDATKKQTTKKSSKK